MRVRPARFAKNWPVTIAVATMEPMMGETRSWRRKRARLAIPSGQRVSRSEREAVGRDAELEADFARRRHELEALFAS